MTIYEYIKHLLLLILYVLLKIYNTKLISYEYFLNLDKIFLYILSNLEGTNMKQSNSDKNLNLLKQAISEIIILRRNELGYNQKYAVKKSAIIVKQYSNIERQ